MLSKKYKSDDLLSFCGDTTETFIDCSSCGKEESVMEEMYYAVDTFFKKGWRATERNCYCPKCAPKKLKL